jgi:HNH endonuclease/AP2 domain
LKFIQVSNGKMAIVDDEDFEIVSKHHWHQDGAGYIRTNIWKGNRKDSAPRLHRMVLPNTPKHLHIDHKNGDKLDNRKSNLRICSSSQNARNRGPQNNNTSGYKGVIYDKARSKWRSEICVEGKRKYLGRFTTAEEAAKAYNDAAIQFHGEFAYINKIKEAN